MIRREELESTWHIGVDIGQVVDYTCVAAIERRVAWLPDGRYSNKALVPRDPEYFLRGLERLPLQLDYEEQGRHVAQLLHSSPELADAGVMLDATGVGRAVAEIFRRYIPYARKIVITAGREADRRGTDWYVGKLPLVSQLMAKMHNGSLKAAADLKLWPVLQQELANFRMRFSATSSHVGFGAREGKHDDALLAVAIATWSAERSTARELVPTLGL